MRKFKLLHFNIISIILSMAMLLMLPVNSYTGSYVAGTATPLSPGQTFQVWNAEQPTPGNGGAAASLAIVMSGGISGSPYHVNGFFSAAPGAFEIDVQAAENDVDTQYQTISGGNMTTVDATNQTFYLSCAACSAKFVRLLMRSRTNAVNVTAFIGR